MSRLLARRAGTLSALALALILPAGTLAAQKAAPAAKDPSADRESVRRAVLDYVEGFYEGDSTKLVRALRPDFYKYGFYWNPDSARYVGSQMTWQGAMNFARRVRDSGQPARATSPKEVKLLEVSDQTAAAKLTAWWGIDYLLLGKFDGRWQISHITWQSPPPMP